MQLGEFQTLKVMKKVEFGIYLGDPEGQDQDERVLLPAKQVPEGTELGDSLRVFLYKDSGDRLIATTNQPRLTLGETALLRVAQTGKLGAFLEWGLEKDLFLPFKEQTGKVREGEECLVALYIDKSERLCATMKVYHYLKTDSPYHKDDRVKGMVYEISPNFGTFVAVDGIYSGLISMNEAYGSTEIGEWITARVCGVKEDGKLDLSIREKAYLQIGADAERVLALIDSYDGVLPFNDRANPEVIRRELQMSKNEFKRAVGNLLKNGKIEIGENVIRRNG